MQFESIDESGCGVALLVAVVVTLAVAPSRRSAASTCRKRRLGRDDRGFEATYDHESGGTDQYVVVHHEGDERVLNPDIETGGTRSDGGATEFNLTQADLCPSAADEATVTIPGSGYATLEGDHYLCWPIESRIVVRGPETARTLTPFPDGDPDDRAH